jgi:general stress protein YciG
MAGTAVGGRKTAQRNLEKNPNFYREIGSRGGKAGTGHEFAHGKISPSEAGRIGGQKSRRTKASVQEEKKSFLKRLFS